VAQGAFGAVYASLNSEQQWRVDNTWNNIMSYHPAATLTVLTADQLDFEADASNGPRFNVATGRTRFVDRNGNAGNQQGTSTLPFVTVLSGVNAAADRDVVQVRPGNYNEPGAYTRPVTLRATRGAATIGRP